MIAYIQYPEVEIPLLIALGVIAYLLLGSYIFGVCAKRWGKTETTYSLSIFVSPAIFIWPLVGLIFLCVRVWEIGRGRKIKGEW